MFAHLMDLILLGFVQLGVVLGVHDVRAFLDTLLDQLLVYWLGTVLRLFLQHVVEVEVVLQLLNLLTLNDFVKVHDVCQAKIAVVVVFNFLKINL